MSNIHLVYGTDEGAVSEAALKLFNKLKPEGGDDFANDIIEGGADNAEDAYQKISLTIEALLTLPFFGGQKIVWLKNANFLGNDRTSEAERTITGLERLLETLKAGIGDDVIFIISTPAINKARRFFKYLKANATLSEHNKIDTKKEGWELLVADLVRNRAAKFKLEFEQDALDLFVTLAGEDTRQINSELEKLDLYLGDNRRNITLADIRLNVPLSRAGVIFEIGNSIQKADAPRALELIDQQLSQGTAAIAIIRASVIPTIRNLFMAKAITEMFPNQQLNKFNLGKVLASIPESETLWLPQKKAGGVNTWGLGLALDASRKFPMHALKRAMESCLHADLSLVSTAHDHRTTLHRLVVELISSCPAKLRAS